MPNQSNMNMQGPPRGPPPGQQMGPGPNNMGNVQQMPAPHVNPAFFNQNSGKFAHKLWCAADFVVYSRNN